MTDTIDMICSEAFIIVKKILFQSCCFEESVKFSSLLFSYCYFESNFNISVIFLHG